MRQFSVLLSGLKTCRITKDLQLGRQVHAELVETHNDSNLYIVTTLMKLYASCGSMVDAHRLFDSMDKPDVVSWNVLLMGYADIGESLISLELFSNMKSLGYEPDSVTYIAALKSCTCLALSSENHDCLERGREIHSEIRINLNHHLQSTLINMYAKCGDMKCARQVFESITKPVLVSWNVLLLGYVENGEGQATLELFSKMKAVECKPDAITYLAAVKACASLAINGDKSQNESILKLGRAIHLEIGNHLDNYLESSLVEMYAKCGSMTDACRVFESIRKPDVVSWNTLLMGYADNGDELAALKFFSRMKTSDYLPDSVTYVAVLKACTSLASNGDAIQKRDCLELGKAIHLQIGYHLDHYLQNKLMDMYASCGCMLESWNVFDSLHQPDVVSWTTLIRACTENGDGHAALEIFLNMKARGCIPNSVTYLAVFKACGLCGALALGRRLHSQIIELTPQVLTCIVDFYAKCGSMVEAQEVFDLHSKSRHAATYSALLAGYAKFGDSDSVFRLFDLMQDEGFEPDAVTFVSVLLCCSHAGLLEKSWEYFLAMPQHGVFPTVMHYTCMVDVLGRANRLNEASYMLRGMPFNPDAVVWTSILGACEKWKNVEVGRLAFQSLLNMNKNDTSAHVLMGHIYATRCMWVEREIVLKHLKQRS